MQTANRTLKSFSLRTQVKFWLFSILGLLIFVISIDIGGKKQLGLVHIGGLVTTLLGNFNVWVIFLFCILGVIRVFTRLKKSFRGVFSSFMSCLTIIGFIFMGLYVFGIAPDFLSKSSMMPFIVTSALYPTLLYTGISPVFMPFLLDCGLLEMMGVIMRPVVRHVFKIPGRASVLTISAFFGSAPVGIVSVDQMYRNGQFTLRESVVMGTCFCTTAVSMMVIMAGMAGIMEYWGIYLAIALIGLAVVAAINCRIYPLSKIKDTTYQDIPYKAEEQEGDKRFILIRALCAGYQQAEELKNLPKKMLNLLKNSAGLLCDIMASTTSIVVIGLLISEYTPIFEWIGYIFYPFALLIGLQEPMMAATGAASSIIVITQPAIYAGMISDLATKIVLCCIPVLNTITIPLTMPVFLNATVPYKTKDLLIIFVERMILSIIVLSLLAKVFILFLK